VEPLRIGLLSTAAIGRRIVTAARATPLAELVAVGSRDAARAEEAAREHGIGRAHGSYEALLADPELEAVYVALPAALHAEWAVRALEAGKHVLVEKPFALRPADAERAFAAAAERGLVLSEAFMWRHHPQTAELTRRIADGAIGELRLVRAAFSFTLDRPADPRWDPVLGGGALLDVGTYCVSAARLLAGEPDLDRVRATAVRAPGGVDVRLAGSMAHPGGVVSVFDCAFDLPYRAGLEVVGAEGALVLDDPWGGRMPGILLRRGGDAERIEVPPADPYRLELEDLARAVRTGATPLVGRDDSVGQAAALEAIAAAAADGAPPG
jgi:predicted dehydrogenase